MSRILVAGMGNLLRGDDGFGIRVIRKLAGMTLPPGVEVYEAGGAGIALAQKLMDGYDACIVADAAAAPGLPGTLHRFEPREFAVPVEIGMHGLDPSKVFVLAKAMGALPERVIVIGCVPRETEELRDALSPPVAAAVDAAVNLILAELAGLGWK